MTDAASPYRSCRACGYAVTRSSERCRDCGVAFPAVPFTAVLTAAAGLCAATCLGAGWLCLFVLGVAGVTGPRVPEAAGALAGAGLLALVLGCVTLLAARAGGGGPRFAAGGALVGLAVGAMTGKALLAGAGLLPLSASAAGIALATGTLLRTAGRGDRGPTLVERELLLHATLAAVDAAEGELAAASARLAACEPTEANRRAGAALARAESARREERGRLAGGLLRIALLRWGSRLKALSAGFASLGAEACRARREALAEVAAEGARLADDWRSEPSAREEAQLLSAALGACRKLDEALLVREVMLLSRPSDRLVEEGPELLLPNVDALFSAALEGLEEGERSASAQRRAEAELAALEDLPPLARGESSGA